MGCSATGGASRLSKPQIGTTGFVVRNRVCRRVSKPCKGPRTDACAAKQFGANMPPFPGLYDDDAEQRPCADCAATLNVSPHIAGAGVPVVCPLCGIQWAR